jgi:hypothetical protein
VRESCAVARMRVETRARARNTDDDDTFGGFRATGARPLGGSDQCRTSEPEAWPPRRRATKSSPKLPPGSRSPSLSSSIPKVSLAKAKAGSSTRWTGRRAPLTWRGVSLGRGRGAAGQGLPGWSVARSGIP